MSYATWSLSFQGNQKSDLVVVVAAGRYDTVISIKRREDMCKKTQGSEQVELSEFFL